MRKLPLALFFSAAVLFPLFATAEEPAPQTDVAITAQEAVFEYPRVAARQERSAKPRAKTPKVQTLSCDNSCRCGFICNDFGFCNSAMSNCQVLTVPPDCSEGDCSGCACW